MEYSVIVSKRAQKEIENAVEYYQKDSETTPLVFIKKLENSSKFIAKSPFTQRVRYKNVRARKIKKFPYNIYFVINENNQQARVLACFYQKRNPKQHPRL